MWGKIIIPVYRLWLNGLYGLYGPRCPLSSKRPINLISLSPFNTLRPRQNGRHFADDTFKPIFLNEDIRISTKMSLKFYPKGPINNIPALVLIMAWRRPGDKPLSEPMMVCLLRHIWVTRPQWVIQIEVDNPPVRADQGYGSLREPATKKGSFLSNSFGYSKVFVCNMI